MSQNNIFLTAGEPIRRLVRTVDYPITGWRLNPENGNRQVEFILVNPEKEFVYDRDVVEIYTEHENKFFTQKNRYLFEAGLLKEFKGAQDEVDLTNALNDDEVFAIANTRLVQDLKERLGKLTSKIAVRRVLVTAQEIGRPAKIIALINDRLAELT